MVLLTFISYLVGFFVEFPFQNNYILIYFSLLGCFIQSIVIHEDMNNIRFAPVPILCFEMIKSSASVDGILYNLLRTHPVFLSVVSPVGSEFPKVCQFFF